MKKLLVAFFISLWSSIAVANVPCTLPFTLTNGTIADATQVMADYNALVTCLTNAAAAGANNDITALLALTTPLTPAKGGTPVFLGGTSTGSSNAYVVATAVPAGFSLTNQYTVIFAPNFTNTGAATLAVNGLTAKAIEKQTATGLAALVANDIQTGQLVVARYDGTQFEITSFIGLASLAATDQVLAGGAVVTAYSGGSQSGGGTYTVDCGLSPLQYITNAGAFTIAAPANDGSCMLLIIKMASASTVSFSGFTVNSNTGEALDTTNGHKFTMSIWRINGVSSYTIKALQ